MIGHRFLLSFSQLNSIRRADKRSVIRQIVPPLGGMRFAFPPYGTSMRQPQAIA
jgi:hypothetical protein